MSRKVADDRLTKLRDAVMVRDGLRCQYCGRRVVKGKTRGQNGLVIDHADSRDECIENLCVCCRSCNSSKGNLSTDEWIAKFRRQVEAGRIAEVRIRNIRWLQKKLAAGEDAP